MNDHRDLRVIAERVAASAAEHLRELPRPWETGTDGTGVGTKSSPTDVVTISDVSVERRIRAHLTELRPCDAVLGEEAGADAGTDAGRDGVLWVVDPIDGTVNYMYGLPWYAISVAAVRGGFTVAAAVVEPDSGRLWSASLGGGATRDGVPLRVTAVTDTALALLATGFAYQPSRRARQIAFVAELIPGVRDIRRAGSAALDLCAVAAGWVDAYVEHGTNWWDWAAAGLIATEAGAVLRTPGVSGAASPDDGLGEDAVFAAAPGVAEALRGMAVVAGAAGV